MGKVLSQKAINRETFRMQMSRILQAKKSVSIEAIEENLFLLDFSSSIDRRNVLYGGPWNFFKDHVIFKEPDGLENLAFMSFSHI